MNAKRRTVLHGLVLALAYGAGLVQAAPAAPDARQLTAFFRAVQLDDAKTVARMLGTAVNANERNPLGGEPGIVLALREDAMEVFKVFLAHPGTDLEARAANGNTALMMAAFKRKRPAVQALLDKGAKLNGSSWTALHYAAASGDDEIVRLLLARGAQLNPLSPLKSGAYTPLMMAAREGHDGTALLLMEKGADPRLVNSEGLSAVQLAERAGKPRVAAAIARAMR